MKIHVFKLGPSAVVSGSEDDEDSKLNKGLTGSTDKFIAEWATGRQSLVGVKYILVRVLSCPQVSVRSLPTMLSLPLTEESSLPYSSLGL